MCANRWSIAQQYEKGFWRNLSQKIEEGAISQLDWYRWKASQLEKRLKEHAPYKKDWKILEIGTGPVGIVSFITCGERYAIDPLEAFYRESPTLTKLRDPAVTYLEGQGEDLPFPDQQFSLIINDNVLDHTENACNLLGEIRRVTRRGGLLYLNLNIHTSLGAVLHGLLASLCIDRGHPHSFTKAGIRDLLTEKNFNILTEEVEDYGEAKKRNCQSERLKDKIKGYTGISEILYHALCAKA